MANSSKVTSSRLTNHNRQPAIDFCIAIIEVPDWELCIGSVNADKSIRRPCRKQRFESMKCKTTNRADSVATHLFVISECLEVRSC